MAIKFTQTRSVKSNLYQGGAKGKSREVAKCAEIVREGVTLADLVAQYTEAVVINDCCNKRDETAANDARTAALEALGIVAKTAAYWKEQATEELTKEILDLVKTQPGGVLGWISKRAKELEAAAGEDAGE